MTRPSLTAILVVVMGIPRPAAVWAQNAPDLGGRWTLNREFIEQGGGSAAEAGANAATDRLRAQAFSQQPDAELKGLTKLGIVVEDLSAQAAACGLNQGALETAVSKGPSA